MKNVLKWYMLAFLLVSNFVVFAQGDTPPETTPVDPEVTDPDVAPINAKLIWLAVVGILFAYYYFSQKRKEQLN
jgi:mannose/fructose/N-acetylgalactosamine-specific phosphotransferase system component IIC